MSTVLDHCAAYGCRAKVSHNHLMCRKHWFLVPGNIRSQILHICNPGESVDERNSDGWLSLAVAACLAVAVKEKVFEREGARRAYKAFVEELKGCRANGEGDDEKQT